jgi:GMP synthase (glutamine-hydrolysing)
MTRSAKNRDALRFVLLQARNPNDRVRDEERDAFADRLAVSAHQIRQVDILHDRLGCELREGVDAVLVGGAGEYGVVDPIPPVSAMIDFLVECAESGQAIFASCFGFQALVVGLGGEVIADEDHAEVGTYELYTTPEAMKDEVFGHLPARFNAQLGHKDRAVRMPSSVKNLAGSKACPHQALHIPGTKVYATQFHPELTWRDNRTRFERYMEQYGRLFGEQEAQNRLDSHRPSPEANSLLRRFVDHCLLGLEP